MQFSLLLCSMHGCLINAPEFLVPLMLASASSSTLNFVVLMYSDVDDRLLVEVEVVQS